MRIVIFGASGGAIKVAETFYNLNIKFDFFVDNDKKKWGSFICKKEVKNPESLLEEECQIIIASDYQDEIEEQLNQMGILNCVILKEELILPKLLEKKVEIQKLTESIYENQENSVIFDLIDAGICLGGIETWTLNLMREFKKRKKRVFLFSREIDVEVPNEIKDDTVLFQVEYSKYFNTVKKATIEIIKCLPCVVITNWQSQIMMAAILAKKLYPGKVKVISVLHNDKIALYRRQQFFEPYTDRIIGVSQKINQTLIKKYMIPESKIFYKESPITLSEKKHAAYTYNKSETLKIGFACRISKYQKRVDLLIKLIELLDQEKVNYHMRIAGDGSYFSKIEDWYLKYRNRNKIELMGRVPREKMQDFWKDEDIFLSVSDFEGASISMLEAMSAGAVPVVTRVSGVEEFVENQVNGFYTEPKDIEGICKILSYLDNHREQLPIYGKRALTIVREKCKLSDYADIFQNEIEELLKVK